MSAPTSQEVIATFERCTGIALRVIPHSVQRQAGDFVAHGFGLADLELVICWIKRQIAHRKSGFTEASYTWRRMFGEHGAADEFLVFQERLGLARAEQNRGWRPRLAHEPAKPASPAPASAPLTDEEWNAAAAKGREQLRTLRESLRGGPA